MTTMKLYDTVEALDLVTTWLIESEGEITEPIAELLETAGHDFTDKVEQVAIKVLELRAVAAAQREEVDRMRARAESSRKAAESLTRYLQQNMERAAVPKVSGIRCTVQVQQSAPMLVGELDEPALKTLAATQPALVRYVPERYELDRRAALAAHKAGQLLPAALAVEVHTSLRIR